MFASRLVIELVNVPEVMPSFVLVTKLIVGLGDVDHTTPLDSIAPPPSDVTFPPEVADEFVIELIAVVVTVGRTTFENGISL